nr:hypothetical protein [Tanacetum cinerariifolium]
VIGTVVSFLTLSLFTRLGWTKQEGPSSSRIFKVHNLNVVFLILGQKKVNLIQKNHSIALFFPVKKEVTADEFLKGAIKKMVGDVDNIPFNLDESPLNADGSSKGNESYEDGEGSSKATEEDRGDSGSGKRIIIDLDDYDEEAAIAKRGKNSCKVRA